MSHALQVADGALAIPSSAFGAIGALGLIGAALFVADPEKRRGPNPPCYNPEPLPLTFNR